MRLNLLGKNSSAALHKVDKGIYLWEVLNCVLYVFSGVIMNIIN